MLAAPRAGPAIRWPAARGIGAPVAFLVRNAIAPAVPRRARSLSAEQYADLRAGEPSTPPASSR